MMKSRAISVIAACAILSFLCLPAAASEYDGEDDLHGGTGGSLHGETDSSISGGLQSGSNGDSGSDLNNGTESFIGTGPAMLGGGGLPGLGGGDGGGGLPGLGGGDGGSPVVYTIVSLVYDARDFTCSIGLGGIFDPGILPAYINGVYDDGALAILDIDWEYHGFDSSVAGTHGIKGNIVLPYIPPQYNEVIEFADGLEPYVWFTVTVAGGEDEPSQGDDGLRFVSTYYISGWIMTNLNKTVTQPQLWMAINGEEFSAAESSAVNYAFQPYIDGEDCTRLIIELQTLQEWYYYEFYVLCLDYGASDYLFVNLSNGYSHVSSGIGGDRTGEDRGEQAPPGLHQDTPDDDPPGGGQGGGQDSGGQQGGGQPGTSSKKGKSAGTQAYQPLQATALEMQPPHSLFSLQNYSTDSETPHTTEQPDSGIAMQALPSDTPLTGAAPFASLSADASDTHAGSHEQGFSGGATDYSQQNMQMPDISEPAQPGSVGAKGRPDLSSYTPLMLSVAAGISGAGAYIMLSVKKRMHR